MARLYAQSGDAQRAVDTLSAVPEDDRSARIEFELGTSLDQLKKPKDAAAAYRRSLELEPDNPDAERALANALLADDQLDEALKVLNTLVAADPTSRRSSGGRATTRRRWRRWRRPRRRCRTRWS
jgi:tetratricopeptide (TPR) repeat protein